MKSFIIIAGLAAMAGALAIILMSPGRGATIEALRLEKAIEEIRAETSKALARERTDRLIIIGVFSLGIIGVLGVAGLVVFGSILFLKLFTQPPAAQPTPIIQIKEKKSIEAPVYCPGTGVETGYFITWERG